MIYKLPIFTIMFFIISLSQLSAIASEDKQLDAITKFISESAKMIGGDKQIGVKLSMDWKENTEVAEITAYTDVKRVATIDAIIGYLNTNEKKVFPEITSSDHAIMLVASRLISLKYINTLVLSSKYDIIVKDYIDSEIADLTMMLNGTIDYGQMYINSRKSREDKIAMFLYKNKDFVTERLTLEMKDSNTAKILANKTSLISLFQTCSSIPQSCSKL